MARRGGVAFYYSLASVLGHQFYTVLIWKLVRTCSFIEMPAREYTGGLDRRLCLVFGSTNQPFISTPSPVWVVNCRGGSRLFYWGGHKFFIQWDVFRVDKRGREAPENWGRSPNRGRSPRHSGGRGLGRGLGEPLPRKFLKIEIWNHSFWCIVEAKIRTISHTS